MATKKSAKKEDHTGEIVAIGASMIAAAAAAGAGYYFYGDKSAKKHRVATTKWAKGFQADVMKEAKKDWKKFQKLDKKAMAAIVDNATAAYVGVRNVNREDLMGAAAELKHNWKAIQAELEDAGSKGKKAVAKAAKKVTAAPKRAIAKGSGSKKVTSKKAVKKG
jgi:hydroxylamine reductase (hybrid-cluster protein)